MKYRVWWIPQVPGKPFRVEVPNVEHGVLLLKTLADYDNFQFKQNLKLDYCNSGGLEMLPPWIPDVNACGHREWEDWYDEDTGYDDPIEWWEEYGQHGC